MIPLFLRAPINGPIAILVLSAAMAAVGVALVPNVMWFSTYAMITGLALAVAAVTLNAAHNALPTGSLGQLLYETDHPSRVDRADTIRRDAGLHQ